MLKNILPSNIYFAIKHIPYESLCELRFRKDNYVIVNILGKNFYLTPDSYSDSPLNAIISTRGSINSILEKISNNSLYTINDELLEGYVTIQGGIRIGICGEVVSINGEIKTIKNISSINFRFSHNVENCSLKIYNYLVKNGLVRNTLIISPPGAGKTTYLRDLICQITKREKLINILVVDERKEISSYFDGENVVEIENIDVYSNSTKKFAFNNGIRSMKPDIIVTDEIDISRDIDDIKNALTCGVKVIATIHANSINDIKIKPEFRSILDNGLFERYVLLSNSNGIGTLEGVFDSELRFLGV